MTQQEALFDYCLRLGDNSLILGHRLSEWSGHGPILEEDLALTNIALDLVGQSRTLLTYAGQLEGKGRSEDDLAFFRNDHEYRNALITEQDNGDFAFTIARQFYYNAFAFLNFTALQKSTDATLAGVAAKSIKETTYHLRHCSEWVIRLGDGTEESHNRMQEALNLLWMYTQDLFAVTEGDQLLLTAGIAADTASLKPQWDKMICEVIERATLTIPASTFMMKGSRQGKHTERLSYLLAEMQSLPRSLPGLNW